MASPQLTANYSTALVSLIQRGDAPIDGIEVGPWFSPEKIGEFRESLPGWPFQFHAGSYLSRNKYRSGALKRLQRYLANSDSRWISVHIELLPLYVYRFSAHLGINLPAPEPHRAAQRFMRDLDRLRSQARLPLILENLPSPPVQNFAYASDASLIAEILEATQDGLLLDLAHARVVTSNQGMDVKAYLRRLPLQRVRQVHVSGPRQRNGHLQDAHESMQEEDYALLVWTLENCQPQVVTLEYFRERDALREQLRRLREIISG